MYLDLVRFLTNDFCLLEKFGHSCPLLLNNLFLKEILRSLLGSPASHLLLIESSSLLKAED